MNTKLMISDYKADTTILMPKRGSIVEELSGIINLDSGMDYKDKHSEK